MTLAGAQIMSFQRLILGLLLALLTSTASAQSAESALMPGKVVRSHAKYEEDCKKCHRPFDKDAQNSLCLDCHKETAQDVSKKHGLHGRMKEKPCRECHTDHKGRDVNIAPIDEKTFDHDQTDFSLKGGHLGPKIKCDSCHKRDVKRRDTPSDCHACHEKDDVHKGSLGKVCRDCHGEQDWKKTSFDHAKTKFALAGKHRDVKCEDCHPKTQPVKETPRECVGCHRKDDEHKGRFGTKCETCHDDRSWKESTFDHDRDTKYKLLGKHRPAKCNSCHVNAAREKLPTTCNACHRKDDKHKGLFGEKCDTCHTEQTWKYPPGPNIEAKFDHDRDTKYVLKGKHKETKCDSCHKGDLYKDKLKSTCIACHRKDDKHKDRFGEKCENCHDERDWKTLLFAHDKDTKYVLKGKHKETKCDACHTGTLYKEKFDTACIACHKKDDKHNGQEGKQCERCHDEKKWTGVRIDHGLARFPLLGKHNKLECKKCHETPAFRDAKRECSACHLKEDKHKAKLTLQCEVCHNARDWKIWDFDHGKRTKFVLDGAHKPLDCLTCHKTAQEKKIKLATTCVSCHLHDDTHQQNFGRQCERCHVTASFREIKAGMGRAN